MSLNSQKSKQKRFQILMMKAVDNDLSKHEAIEFNDILNQSKSYQKEWTRFKQIKEITMSMKFKSPPKEVWDNYWVNVYNRIERGIAWILFSIGACILLTYGGFRIIESIISDSQSTIFFKVGLLTIIGGSAILIVSVIREKWFIRAKDPYREVQR